MTFIKPTNERARQAVKKLVAGDTEGWSPSEFRSILSALGSELANGVSVDQENSPVIVAVEAEEVDDLAQGFIETLENRGASCRLACFWMRRMVIRDVNRKPISISGTSSQQYMDDTRDATTLIVLQPVATRPEFVEFVVNKFKHTNEITEIVLVSPVFHAAVFRPAWDLIERTYAFKPEVVAFDRVDEETNVLKLTRHGSERLLGASRSDLKKRFFPDFAAYRMDNRPRPDPDHTRVASHTPNGR